MWNVSRELLCDRDSFPPSGDRCDAPVGNFAFSTHHCTFFGGVWRFFWGQLPSFIGAATILIESPRWLLATGDAHAATEVLKVVARLNGKPYPDHVSGSWQLAVGRWLLVAGGWGHAPPRVRRMEAGVSTVSRHFALDPV